MLILRFGRNMLLGRQGPSLAARAGEQVSYQVLEIPGSEYAADR